jgi:hypothetical protein
MTHRLRDMADKDIATFQGEVPRAGDTIFVVISHTGLTKFKIEDVSWAIVDGTSRACVYGYMIDSNLPPMNW